MNLTPRESGRGKEIIRSPLQNFFKNTLSFYKTLTCLCSSIGCIAIPACARPQAGAAPGARRTLGSADAKRGCICTSGRGGEERRMTGRRPVGGGPLRAPPTWLAPRAAGAPPSGPGRAHPCCTGPISSSSWRIRPPRATMDLASWARPALRVHVWTAPRPFPSRKKTPIGIDLAPLGRECHPAPL